MKTAIQRTAPLLALLMAAVLAALALPALAESAPAAPAPTSVRLDPSGTVRLAIGAELTLTPVLTPADAAADCTWKSSAKKIASVSGGVVTAHKAGSATVTVTTANRKKASVKIKVYDPYLPTAVKLDQKGTVRLPLGETLTLSAALSPDTAQSALTWKSSKRKVATVSGGTVAARRVGTATITVSTRNGKKAKVKVKVYDPTLPTAVKLDMTGTQRLMVMNRLQLSATMSPETAQSALKWKSSNKKVAVVDSSGAVSGIAPGTATITVSTRNGKKAKVKVKVTDDGKQPITTQPDYKLPYVIYACKNSHTVAILARDDAGAWTRVIRTFPTGTGRNNATDVGIFFLSKKERWHKWGSGYSPYANKLSVGIYLHGPIYKSKNQNTIRPSYYNCIGTDCSSGCLRTTCGCAAWVYYNCPVGTQVIVAQNSRFSAPRPKKLKSSATKDPTDPGAYPEVLVTDFTVDPGALALNPGEARALVPGGVYPANASCGEFAYASSDSAVATVSATGVVTAVAPGDAVITVTARDAFRRAIQVPVSVGAIAASANPAEASEAAVPIDTANESESASPAEASEAAVPIDTADAAEALDADALTVDEADTVEPPPEQDAIPTEGDPFAMEEIPVEE